jgi:hypothetical protein
MPAKTTATKKKPVDSKENEKKDEELTQPTPEESPANGGGGDDDNKKEKEAAPSSSQPASSQALAKAQKKGKAAAVGDAAGVGGKHLPTSVAKRHQNKNRVMSKDHMLYKASSGCAKILSQAGIRSCFPAMKHVLVAKVWENEMASLISDAVTWVLAKKGKTLSVRAIETALKTNGANRRQMCFGFKPKPSTKKTAKKKQQS